MISYIKPFWSMVVTDLILFKRIAKDTFINVVIWTACVLIVNAFLLPGFGIQEAFGIISFAGLVATVGIMEVSQSVSEMLVDFEHGRLVHHYATVPLPSVFVFLKRIFSGTIINIFFVVVAFPAGKLILWNSFPFSQVNWPKLMLIVLIGSIFYSVFAIFVASVVKKSEKRRNVWFRFIFPVWFFGGFAFSWVILNQTSKVFSYLALFNPVIYITEAYRGAIIGPENYINFWYCVGALVIFTGLLGYFGIVRLKKYLDFV